jgi:hypothetical protein
MLDCCPVCLEPPARRRRLQLGCGHALCADCARSVVDAATLHRARAEPPRCPLCRAPFAPAALGRVFGRARVWVGDTAHTLWLARDGRLGLRALKLDLDGIARTRADREVAGDICSGHSVCLRLGGAVRYCVLPHLLSVLIGLPGVADTLVLQRLRRAALDALHAADADAEPPQALVLGGPDLAVAAGGADVTLLVR